MSNESFTASGIVKDGTAPDSHAEQDIEILSTIPKQFCIEDEKTANWLVQKVVAARQYALRVKEWADQELRRAEREEQTLMFLFGRQIEEWAKGEIDKLKGRRKSLNLPAGCVGFRRLGPRLVIDDDRRVLVWAKENCPQAVVVVEKLSKTCIDEYVEKTGAVPDEGIHVEPAVERLYIR